ncbi:MAG: hypothetical protein V4469_04510 [Patescibacteria group bacterium]
MSKNSDIYIKIDIKYSDTILKEAGYSEHESFHKGKVKKGYIKYTIGHGKRFHAFVDNDFIKIHIDNTVRGLHVSANRKYRLYLKKECKLIKHIHSKYLPKIEKVIPKKKLEKRKFKNEYAPNIIELQKLNLNNKVSFFKKILNFFR